MVTPDTVRALTDIAAGAGVTSSLATLTRATALYAAYRAARLVPEAFARGGDLSRSESQALFERSIRAEFAVAMRTSERRMVRTLEHAQLLVEELPRTRGALADGAILWEASEVICDAAATLPAGSRAAFDERAAEVALTATPTQLRRAVARMRDELHDEPLAVRHVRARADRSVWISPEIDGMATLGALLPAPIARGRTTASTASPGVSGTLLPATAPQTAPQMSARSRTCAPMPSPNCSPTATSRGRHP
ncbi:DUF222 domain-containing protein [Rathayibacter oskolensis]|uniref:DUF222 domain-containing protein n=1 Tax=Rathayibacter oskolensis TaxID=1891671 RepID=UPI00265E7A61|nr:DUF222 domain-containing protein [Rathayibacter oskolensis]WKK73127.1 DUF222 domain-containing protein [Rathayibacter oskolensis]